MPSLGPDMESARVIEWLVKPGDSIKRGDVIVVVETDKGAIEIEVFEDAVVEGLVAPLEAELAVGAVLARLRGVNESTAVAPVAVASIAETAVVAAPPPRAVARPPAPPSFAAVDASGFARASPAARKRAAERGIALGGVAGSGPQGAVLLADIEAASATPRAKRASGFEPAAMRRAIAAAMSRAKREIPHYYLCLEVSMAAALAWLQRANEIRTVESRLLPAVLLLRAVGLALNKTPSLNGFYEDNGFRAGTGIHIGWAVALRGGGLIAPAIHDVDKKNLDALMAALRDVVMRARGGGLRSSEMMDATITVTSLGERGADSVLPIIHPPQVAMIGFGRIVERPWAVAGRIEVHPAVTLSLAADHRVSDGHLGSQLLAEIERLLNDPEQL
jgi:pyruvate dehydrogenase E2 component (dihydrolipoamide acetyltransferase)